MTVKTFKKIVRSPENLLSPDGILVARCEESADGFRVVVVENIFGISGSRVVKEWFKKAARWIDDAVVSDRNGNKASIKYWGSRQAARASLKTLEDCWNCWNCQYCTECHRCGYMLCSQRCHDTVDSDRERVGLEGGVVR